MVHKEIDARGNLAVDGSREGFVVNFSVGEWSQERGAAALKK